MLDGIDGTTEIVDIEIDIDGEVMPPKNDKIALIDADTVAFIACLNTEEEIEVLPKDFNSKEAWEELINDPNFDEENGVLYHTDIDLALAKAEEKLQRIKDKTGCLTCELWFTGGRENFRYKVKEDYKANRVNNRAPAGLKEVKEALLKRYNGGICTKWEADDMVVYLKKKYPEKYILCAIDKDVYNSVPGKHFNYYESEQWNKTMKWIETSEATAKLWPYLQTILGDSTDNIKGCKGIGPKKALKFVNEDMTEQEMWNGVVKAWESKGMSSIDALITMNLVNMHLLQEVDGELKIVLWHPEQILCEEMNTEGEDNE